MKALKVNWKRPVFKRLLTPNVRFTSTSSEGEYKEKAVYPPILDLSEEAVERRKKDSLFEKYKQLHTVEEKLFALNLPKYYGWNSLVLKEGTYPYNFLPFVKHITRTKHYCGNNEILYKVLGLDKEECKDILEKLRHEIQQVVLFELKGRRWQHESSPDGVGKYSDSQLQNIVGQNIVRQINNVIISALSSQHSHLFSSTIDYETRVEGFWAVGGFHLSDAEIQARIDKDKKISDENKNRVVDHWIQYIGTPCLQVRMDKPLRVVDTEVLEAAAQSSQQDVDGEKLSLENSISPQPQDPSDAYGLSFARRHGTNIPGFWPGSKNEFGLLSYHLCGHLLDRPPHFGQEEAADTISCQAILGSFSWLLAQASYLGFSTFHELTYPLVNQCIVTDGHYFSSHIYQLNTLLLHSDNISNNPRTNISLSLPYQPLYQDIEANQFMGWNDEVIESILMMYLNKPEERKEVNMKPYLHDNERYISDIEDDERRVWLHRQFRHMYSNRSRSRLPYEIYDWERIYKVRFETRPMDARLRPFELSADPLEERKYYQHMHEYIPRSQRTRKKHWTGWRAKFKKTYYPEIEY